METKALLGLHADRPNCIFDIYPVVRFARDTNEIGGGAT